MINIRFRVRFTYGVRVTVTDRVRVRFVIRVRVKFSLSRQWRGDCGISFPLFFIIQVYKHSRLWFPSRMG